MISKTRRTTVKTTLKEGMFFQAEFTDGHLKNVYLNLIGCGNLQLSYLQLRELLIQSAEMVEVIEKGVV